MSTPSPAHEGSSQPTPPAQAADQPAPTNRAARRRKGKGVDPALADGHHGSAAGPAHARTTPQGRRINPVRRTG